MVDYSVFCLLTPDSHPHRIKGGALAWSASEFAAHPCLGEPELMTHNVDGPSRHHCGLLGSHAAEVVHFDDLSQ